MNNRVQGRLAVPRRAAGPVRGAGQGPVPRDPEGLERRPVRGRERRRGHGAGRLDVARRERDSRHRARHQHGGRLRHARRQHHLVAQRAGLRADRLQPGRAGRRMVGRLRRRLAVLLAAGGRPADAGRRHRPAGGRTMRPARAAQDRAGAEAEGDERAARIYRRSASTSATASRTSRRSTISATCWCSAASPPARAATTSSTARAQVLDVEFPELAARIAFHVPDEHDKRHGQAIAAASLPAHRGS